MANYRYAVLLKPDPEQGGYWVEAPALPGLFTYGDTREEALTNAREAIRCYIESLLQHGEALPQEAEGTELVSVEVAA